MTQNPIAVITGASSGIGEMFARKLALRGYNLIIIARRETLLKKIAGEIETETGVEVQILIADLSNMEDTLHVKAVIEEKNNIEILINNAGFATVGKLVSLPLEKPLSMVNLHVQAPTILTHSVLAQMKERKKGYIINVSSIASFLSAPFNVTYSASKAFLNTFSRSLHQEVCMHGIHVQALCPGFTYSGFHDTEELKKLGRSGIPCWMWIDTDLVVKTSLKYLNSNKVIVIPSLRYKIIKFFLINSFFHGLINIATKKRR